MYLGQFNRVNYLFHFEFKDELAEITTLSLQPATSHKLNQRGHK